MIKRLDGKELIEKSLCELLETKSIQDISVKQISNNCGISTRTFYNHFQDKNEAVSSVYLRFMRPYLMCDLDEWYEHLGDFIHSHTKFLENTLSYNGQNSIGDAIIALEWEKLMMHICPEVRKDPEQLQRTKFAIEYMLYGNFGVLMSNSVYHNPNVISQSVLDQYDRVWDFMSPNYPPLIHNNLSMKVTQSSENSLK